MSGRSSISGDLFSPIRWDLSLDSEGIVPESSTNGSSALDSSLFTIASDVDKKSVDIPKLADEEKEQFASVDLASKQAECVGSQSIIVQDTDKHLPCVLPASQNDRSTPNTTKSKRPSSLEKKRSSTKNVSSDTHINTVLRSSFITQRNDRSRNSVQTSQRCSRKSCPSPIPEKEENKNDVPSVSTPVKIDGTKSHKVKQIDDQKNFLEKAENKKNASLRNGTRISTGSEIEPNKVEAKKISEVAARNKQEKTSQARRIESKILGCGSQTHIEANNSSNHHQQPNQPQLNIIEKLVRNAISFELDDIRQLMYQQQLSWVKMHYKSMDEIEKLSLQNEVLVNSVQELVEENRLLRNILLAQQLNA